MEQKKPFIIFIEGGDGSGKSTLANNLVSELSNKFKVVAQTDVMRCSPIGKMIYDLDCFTGLSPMLSFYGRAFSVFSGLELLYKKYSDVEVVVCERHYASTYAYQIAAADIDAQTKNAMLHLLRNGFTEFRNNHKGSFLEVFVDVPSEVALERMNNSRDELDVFERRGNKYHTKVNEAYRYFFSVIDNVTRLNSEEQSPNEMCSQVMKDILKHVEPK